LAEKLSEANFGAINCERSERNIGSENLTGADNQQERLELCCNLKMITNGKVFKVLNYEFFMKNINLIIKDEGIDFKKVEEINKILRNLNLSFSGSSGLMIKNCFNSNNPGGIREALSIFPKENCNVNYSGFKNLLKNGYEISLVNQYGIQKNALRITKENSHIVDLYSIPEKNN